MTETAATLPATRLTPPWWRWMAPGRDVWVEALLRLAAGIGEGRIAVTTPDGRRLAFGRAGGPQAELTLLTPRTARRLFLGGPVGFAESYLDGEWESGDLPALVDLAARNVDRVMAAAGGTVPFRLLNRLRHLSRRNTRRGSRRNIAQHYDLGNDFYRLWLDAGMAYSSGLYADGVETLEDAQDAKMRRVADLLDLSPGQRVLEIGCGWGGLAAHLAACGVHVTGITLSHEQLAWATGRLGGAADLRLQDYRDVSGTFDRVVSIEMIEAVGEEHWPRYFATLRDRLAPGGVAVVQAITIADRLFDGYRREADFIQRHVFPGGMLPSPTVIATHALHAGLRAEEPVMFGASYARTCAEWRRRFLAAWPDVARLGFDERFRRLWDYYLAYCEGGFRAGTIDVGLYRFVRP